MKLLTLLTDFGTEDSYVAELKGVVCSIVPDVRIIDICHRISQGDIGEGAFLLYNAFRYFPDGTFHLAVVDPGVGTDRAIIIVKTMHYAFIGPDNGLMYEAVKSDGVLWTAELLTDRMTDYMRNHFSENPVVRRIIESGTSSTFHGRDIFAPLAGYLLKGLPVENISEKKSKMTVYRFLEPVIRDDRITGKIIHIDHFGNLITNIRPDMLGAEDELFFIAGGKAVSAGRLKRTYSDVQKGGVLVLPGSRGFIEIAVNMGSAKDRFNTSVGDDVFVIRYRRRRP